MPGPAAPVAAAVVFWPEIAAALAVAATWAARIYRAANVIGKTVEAVTTAQSAEEVDNAAKEKARTDAQTKADAAACADGKNCDEDEDCQTARDKVKDALHGTKDVDAINRGLAERLCHWMHGTSEAENIRHETSLKEGVKSVKNAMDWLKNGGPRPYGKTEGATLNKKAKDKILKDCNVPPDLEKDIKELEDEVKAIVKGKPTLPRLPRADFAAACTKDALGLVRQALGK